MKIRIVVSLAACAAVLAGCSDKYKAQSISNEAAGLFAKADQPGTGGSLVVDFEGMREMNLIRTEKDAKGNPLADISLAALPSAAVALRDEEAGPLLARAAVMVAILREWNVWPHVHRFGVIVPPFNPMEGPEAMANGVLMVMAVKGDQKANDELLKGVAAIDRVGGKAKLAPQDGNLCFSDPEIPMPICIKAGNGYFAMGTATALKSLAPVAGASASTAIPLMKIKAAVPGMGKGEVVLEGRGSLKLSATIEGEQAEPIAELEKMANEGLKQLDEGRAEIKKVMQPALDQTKQELAKDAEAPAGMKAAANNLTIDKMLDPDGSYAALRQSMKVTRTDKVLKGEITFPESQVKQLTEGTGLMAGVAVTGILAAIAIPNFIKFECRSKQSEAKSNLRGAYIAQKSYYMEKDAYGASFDEIGFQPEFGNSYTYCMAGKCLPCTKPGCTQYSEQDNPCVQLTNTAPAADGQMPVICAVGNPDGDSDADLWVLDDEGYPDNRTNDCE